MVCREVVGWNTGEGRPAWGGKALAACSGTPRENSYRNSAGSCAEFRYPFKDDAGVC
jgi:hypothetical protein